MFDHILVPLDGSSLAECVLPHLVALAKVDDAQVVLLRVLDPNDRDAQKQAVNPLDWQIQKAEAELYLQETAARLQETGLQVDIELVEGKAAESVIEYTHSHNVNLILLSSHGRSGITGWNVSSVVQKIILRANISLMIVRAYHAQTLALQELHYRKILLPLDGSQRAEAALPIGISLANTHGSQLIAAHVVRQPEMPRRTPPSQEDLELANRITERNRSEAEAYLEELKSRFDANFSTCLIVADSVGNALHNLVSQEEIDLVLLSAHGYTGGTRWRYGSVVIGFIAYGTTPLLVVQDLPPDRIELTQAEISAKEHGGR